MGGRGGGGGGRGHDLGTGCGAVVQGCLSGERRCVWSTVASSFFRNISSPLSHRLDSQVQGRKRPLNGRAFKMHAHGFGEGVWLLGISLSLNPEPRNPGGTGTSAVHAGTSVINLGFSPTTQNMLLLEHAKVVLQRLECLPTASTAARSGGAVKDRRFRAFH